MPGGDLQSIFNVAVTGKRKRTRVSYVDPHIELDDGNDVESELEIGADDSDGEYGQKRKPKKLQRKLRKQEVAALEQKKALKLKEHKPFPFLSLPAELRDCIYEFALMDPKGLWLVTRTKGYRRTIGRGRITDIGPRQERYGWYRDAEGEYIQLDDVGNRKPAFPRKSLTGPPKETPYTLLPNLLAVNKQIHDEAASILYMQPIVVEDTIALHTFLASIGPNNTQLLQDLTVKDWGIYRGTMKTMNHCAMVLLAGAVNLKALHIDCMSVWYRDNGKKLARQIWRESCIFLEKYGAANHRKHAAVDVLRLHGGNFNPRNKGTHQAGQKSPREGYEAEFKRHLRKLLGYRESSEEKAAYEAAIAQRVAAQEDAFLSMQRNTF
ncbi:hypothetical protein K431DRAFT_309479 [Polychaeton citri CBS 116435]|uniref:F-box domain-containing protein n=1 Tax=Polychaeton citri CBS 116435 TaxID=1314669 RepID=A0A9P4QDM3_9PEZI|nr:hypothetical protein K431DRAFT_309479 [Polychaeton citri CBS 116435]